MTLYNLVRAKTATLGTADIVVGSAVLGYKDFSAISDGAIVSYGLQDISGDIVLATEVGIGTWNSATNTLSRDTVNDSSNGGSKISLVTGTAHVYLTAIATDFIHPHISSLDTTTQAIAVIDTPQVITFNTDVVKTKITHSTITSSSKFYADEDGTYVITASAQVFCGIANKAFDLWLRLDGVDVANSNTQVDILNQNDFKRMTSILSVAMLKNQYVEIVMAGTSTQISLIAYAANAVHPATPSIILTIDKIS